MKAIAPRTAAWIAVLSAIFGEAFVNKVLHLVDLVSRLS